MYKDCRQCQIILEYVESQFIGKEEKFLKSDVI